MARIGKIIISVILTLSAVFAPSFFAKENVSASTNDFYFEDATFDYYLENTDGGNKMHVKEVLTAVFPETDQNHGITRAIPFSNLDGKNITIEYDDVLNLTVLRNGVAEPVSKIEKDEDEYIVYIGSASTYVYGEQVYTLEYDFKNVITEFSEYGLNLTGEYSDDVAYQELYWDTNGTGWTQKFNHLTANLHLTREQSQALTSGTSCYVGRYGASGQDRCTISMSDETTFSDIAASDDSAVETSASSAEMIISFETSNLKSGENLTFAVNFEPETFTVPELPKNYSYVILTCIIAAICALIITLVAIFYFKKAHENRKYYKSLFVAPQYTPLKDVSVAEAAHLIFRKTENSYVATLLELAVTGKISVIKGEPTKILKKETWQIKINSTTNLTDSQIDFIKILYGKSCKIEDLEGVTFEVKKHAATSSLAALSRLYASDALDSLKKRGFFQPKSALGGKSAFSRFSGTFAAIIVIVALVYASSSFAGLANDVLSIPGLDPTYGVIISQEILPIVWIILGLVTVATAIIFSILTWKYKNYTKKGLDAANYYDGLYLYINMAETDRIKFLQSVDGADTSPQGIVKLYEKLLPYACLFGLEESWLKSFNKYCQDINYSVNWYDGDDAFITFYVVNTIARDVNSSVRASTSYSESGYSGSSSGSSSFSSGGGGGGFSGGGGGGGGGGGW